MHEIGYSLTILRSKHINGYKKITQNLYGQNKTIADLGEGPIFDVVFYHSLTVVLWL